MQPKTRYAAVGTGGRVQMFLDPLARNFNSTNQLVGLCDSSLTRATYYQKRLSEEFGYPCVPAFHADEFDHMVQATRPDVVIVCTTDATHHEYIIRALHQGCDVITEKPLTTDAQKCRAILAAVEQTGRKVRVTFNARWGPGASKVREVIASGAIGRVQAVNLEYQLNTDHGADYFRRWHSDKDASGGLLVHKSTHHFDLVNWWLDAVPEEVFAYGGLRFYGRENAIARGSEEWTRYDRYAEAGETDDPFHHSLDRKGKHRELYKNAEAESGYIRDRNVFRDGISIEDTMAVLVRYRGGAVLNYSLSAYSPLEGFRVSFVGDRGRIEYYEAHSPHVIDGLSGFNLAASDGDDVSDQGSRLRVYPHFQKGYEVEIPTAEGGHGGSDPALQAQIFSPCPPADALGRNAGHEQGAASALIGIAANRSMESRRPVQIEALCPLCPEARLLSELI